MAKADHRAAVGLARVGIVNLGGEKFGKAHHRLVAGVRDDARDQRHVAIGDDRLVLN